MEQTNPTEKTQYANRIKWAADAEKVLGEPIADTVDVVKKGNELIARWRASTNTGWVQQKQQSK